MRKKSSILVLSALLAGHGNLGFAEDGKVIDLPPKFMPGAWCPTEQGSDIKLSKQIDMFCFLWTTFHSNSPVEVAFTRPNHLGNVTDSTLVVVAENDVNLELSDKDWDVAMTLQQFVPAFVHEGSQTRDLSMDDFKALLTDGNTPNHLKCCVHSGEINLASHASFYSNLLDVDPGQFKEQLVDQNPPLAGYTALGQHLVGAGADAGLVALGLRGIAGLAVRPLSIDGISLGDPRYPLQVNSKIYVRKDNHDATMLFQQMIQREATWIQNDQAILKSHSGN